MKIGDLVQHRIDRSYGTVLEVRGGPKGMVKVYWHNHNYSVVHTSRQIRSIDRTL